MSHATAEKALRRVGASQEQIEDVLRELPDPFDIDSEHVVDTFFKHGLSWDTVIDRMGGSP
jgi:CBS-domain-containing membrane protein